MGTGRDALAARGPVIDPKHPMDVARELVEAHWASDGGRLIQFWNHEFYHHRRDHWAVLDKATVKAVIWNFLDRAWMPTPNDEIVRVKPNLTTVSNVMEALQALSHLPHSITAPAWLVDAETRPDALSLIPCANGLLDPDTRGLISHTPDFFALNCLTFDYDPDADDPVQWEAFLGQLWEDDQECRGTLQEIFGYMLTAETSQEKIFLIEGPKRSGKGTVGRVLTALLGPESVCGPSLSGFGERFGTECLIGKSLALVSDCRVGPKNADRLAEILLSVSGEDAITIGRKYEKDWTGRLSSRFLILTNELPSFKDAASALPSRFIIMRLFESFYDREDPDLTEKLLIELPGILNWALEGRQRLQARGKFIQPAVGQEAMRRMEDLSAPVAAFVRDCCEVHPDGLVSKDDLWKAWAKYAEENNFRKGSKIEFGRQLRAAYPHVTDTRPGDDDRAWSHAGLALLASQGEKDRRPRCPG
jgi:putative DNA primase/helicase